MAQPTAIDASIIRVVLSIARKQDEIIRTLREHTQQLAALRDNVASVEEAATEVARNLPKITDDLQALETQLDGVINSLGFLRWDPLVNPE